MLQASPEAAKRPAVVSDPPSDIPLVRAIRDAVGKVVVGQDVVVERLLIALFTGGHLLLQGVPGLAKTLLVNAWPRPST